MKRILIPLILGLLVASSFFTGCGSQKIRVGSYADPEGILMAQMIIQMLAENGFDVIDAGSTTEIRQAIKDGKVDIYPEYTGYYLAEDTANPISGVVWLKPAPADSKWAIVIPERLSEAKNIRNMSDFAAYVNSEGIIKLISSPDFVSDDVALPTFEEAYGFTLKSDQLVIVPSYNFVYMWTQAADAVNDINAAIAYTTGGKPEEYNLVLLKDDKGAQSEFHPAPLVRKEIYNKYDKQLNRILTPLFASLDDDTLRELNSQSGLAGKEATSEVARKYLVENGYFRYNELQMVQKAMDDMMESKGLKPGQNSITPHLEATSDMSAFPSKEYALYSENMRWPHIMWRQTRGTYSCDSNGRVTQESTGW